MSRSARRSAARRKARRSCSIRGLCTFTTLIVNRCWLFAPTWKPFWRSTRGGQPSIRESSTCLVTMASTFKSSSAAAARATASAILPAAAQFPGSSRSCAMSRFLAESGPVPRRESLPQ